MLHSVEEMFSIIPICFYEASKEVLMTQGEFLVCYTRLKKECSRSSTAYSTEPRAKLPKQGKPRRQPEDLNTTDSCREKPGHRTYSSKTFTNSNLAAKCNLADELAMKCNSYSE